MSKQKAKYDIHKLVRQIDNRLCADCNDTLLSDGNTYASLEPKLFICQKCYFVQKRILPNDFSVFKSLSDEWNEEEVNIMSTGGGNIKQNGIWERYLPNSKIISKPMPTSIEKEREIWTKAKYFLRLFMIPQKIDSFLSFRIMDKLFYDDKDENILLARQVNYLPARILDFYLVIGQGKFSSYINYENSEFIPECVEFKSTILSSCPESKSYSDMTIPDMVSHLVFPKGFYLSSIEHPPQSYHVILTDISRVKIYCCVLLIYELLEPHKVDEIIAVINKDRRTNIIVHGNSTVFVPKALVILSHYPFYHLFSVALKQFYRISLSSAPLPLERYIVNFTNDVPLPPQGIAEVVISIADVVLQIRRPPPNQLPMIDFSYRPLFLLLSIDNILTIFRCIVNEYSLCFYSSSLALLTPVQEAILSFLFPLVWQGVYIPVLERSVMDVIDAPVPYIVGALTELLEGMSMDDRMIASNTIFVNIDNDTLSFQFKLVSDTPSDHTLETNLSTDRSIGSNIHTNYTESPSHIHPSPNSIAKSSNNMNSTTSISRPSSKLVNGSTQEHNVFLSELNQRIPMLPKQATIKLKAKLAEFGGIIFKTIPVQDILSTADLAFPRNEHLIPIPDEVFFDRGIAKRKYSIYSSPTNSQKYNSSNSRGFSSLSYTSSTTATSIVKTSNKISAPSKSNSKGSQNRKHPVMCTVADYNNSYAIGSNNNSNNSNSNNNISMDGNRKMVITPKLSNNSHGIVRESIFDPKNNVDMLDGFDAKEIRGAFLRFFVATMQNYEDVLLSPNKRESLDKVSSGGTMQLRENVVSSLPNLHGIQSQQSTLTMTTYEPSEQGNVKEDESFFGYLSKSQMFCNFEEEKKSNPTQPELMFFDESILEKKNRSLHIFSKKHPTPFLDDKRYDISETYTCPSPSTWAIDDKQKYIYTQYPLIQSDRMGPIQPRKILVQHAEVKRLTNIQSIQILEKIHKKYRIEKPKQSLDSSNHLNHNPSNSNIDIDEWIVSNYRRCRKIVRIFTSFKIRYRYYKLRQQQLRMTTSAMRIQSMIRRYLAMKYLRQEKKLRVLQKQIRYVVYVQSFIRMSIARQRYIRTMHLILCIQSLVRMKRLRDLYIRQRKKVIVMSKYIRGYITRLRQQKLLSTMIESYRAQLLSLWQWEHSSLFHRTICWNTLNLSYTLAKSILSKPTSIKSSGKKSNQRMIYKYLDIALSRDELLRLYESLDLYHYPNIRVKSSMTFEEKFNEVDRSDCLKSFHALATSTPSRGNVNVNTNTYANVNASTPPISMIKFNMKEMRQVDSALSSVAMNRIKANIVKEDSERKSIYGILKNLSDHTKEHMYQPFGLQHEKKRKQTLSNILWMYTNTELNMDQIEASASVSYELGIGVISLGLLSLSNTLLSSDMIRMDPIEVMKQIRIQKAVLEVANIHIYSKKS